VRGRGRGGIGRASRTRSIELPTVSNDGIQVVSEVYEVESRESR